jgi:CubicO group peptidase (beta-lactamase class C family)
MSITRRSTLAGLAAIIYSSPPGWASGVRFAGAVDRARTFDQIRSLVIGVNGDIVIAEAIRGPAVDRAVNVKSVSKTIVAALTGIAIDRGVLPGPDARLSDVAPDLIPRSADPKVGEITVADLLTMQAGLERTSGGNYGAWVSSRNWVADALSRPMVAEPGSRMLYSTGSYHVLGAVLTEVTGRSLLDLARSWLGAPLDVDIPPWTRDPQGYYMGGNEMSLSPLAMFRFGEVYRLGGAVGDTRVMSEQWVRESLTPRTRSFFSGDLYGFGWFIRRVGEHEVAYARGYGGQMIYVVPSLALTVAVTSDPNLPARSDGHVGDLNRLLADVILPEAQKV